MKLTAMNVWMLHPWRFTLPANPQPEMFMMDQHIHSSNYGPMGMACLLPDGEVSLGPAGECQLVLWARVQCLLRVGYWQVCVLWEACHACVGMLVLAFLAGLSLLGGRDPKSRWVETIPVGAWYCLPCGWSIFSRSRISESVSGTCLVR